jgi:hypothetical protein
MADENENKTNWLKVILKVLLWAAVLCVTLVVVAFGLVVGFCALGSRH